MTTGSGFPTSGSATQNRCDKCGQVKWVKGVSCTKSTCLNYVHGYVPPEINDEGTEVSMNNGQAGIVDYK